MATKKKTATRKKAAKGTTKKSAAKLNSKGTCFVMMPMTELFNRYYEELFVPAIEAAGLDPVRSDSFFRPSAIVSDIWQMIQDAKVLVAELTGGNANVFYEVGLAHAIGKPAVLVSERMGSVPFDVAWLRVLLYDKNEPTWGPILRESLTKAITEILADSVEAVPPIFRKPVASEAPKQDASARRLDALEAQVRRLSAYIAHAEPGETITCPSGPAQWKPYVWPNLSAVSEFQRIADGWTELGKAVRNSILHGSAAKEPPARPEDSKPGAGT